MADKIALKRFGTPAEVAAMAVAVLSERFGRLCHRRHDRGRRRYRAA
jgi:hypothetical protein